MIRICSHLTDNNLFNTHQSAYRKNHSTESALLSVYNHLLTAADSNKISALLLLDLSAAFDTIDHSILLHRLEHWFGFSDIVLSWFRSFLSNRKQTVNVGQNTSPSTAVLFGVPQGSVLGPLLFSLYTTPLSHLLNSFKGVSHHLYADDTQVAFSFLPNNLTDSYSYLQSVLSSVFSWMTANKLSVNPDKTEFLLLGPSSKVPTSPSPLIVDNTVINPVHHAKNLGVTFQSDLKFDKHFANISKSCFLHIRDLRRIRSYLSLSAASSLAHALIHSRLDYCNSLFYGLPNSSLSTLQRIQNTLARVVTKSPLRCHITPVLKSLHWLPILHRINFKVCSLTYRILASNQPSYLRSLLNIRTNSHSLRSSSFRPLDNPRYAKHSFGYRSFSHAAPLLWDKLPTSLRSVSSFDTFLRGLKTHLFQNAFPS